MANWTDELKQEVVDSYVEMNPTPENTTELCKQLAEEYSKTSNGIRMILSKAGVYITKAPSSATTGSATDDKPKKASKADSIAALVTEIESQGKEVDMDVLSKLTGKAAIYLISIIK